MDGVNDDDETINLTVLIKELKKYSISNTYIKNGLPIISQHVIMMNVTFRGV